MDQNSPKHVIQEARPKLSILAPLTSAICWGFGVINILIGLGFFLFLGRGELRTPLLFVNNLLTLEVWGGIFFILGLFMFYALRKNNWGLIKLSLLIGLAVKTAWLITLILRTFDNPATILWTIVWGFFTYVQAMTYVHFLPPNGGTSDAN